jgi:FkbM family methyltransferase
MRASHWLSPQPAPLREWWQADGDGTMRLDYDLSADAIVLDVGGYEGQWASDIFGRFACRVEIFEPVPAYAERIAARFERNPSVTVHAFGISAQDERAHASLAGDSTSHVRHPSESAIAIELRSAATVFAELELERVDLMKLNIEGAEYDLLNHLIDTGLISRIVDLQVQFHDLGPGSREAMEVLRGRLAETHEPVFAFDFVWESWRRRAAAPTPG